MVRFSRIEARLWLLGLLLGGLWGAGWVRAELPEAIEVFAETHCYECHDDSIAKGDFDLISLSRDLSDPKAMAAWVRVFDRIEQGEMPPPEKSADLSVEDRGALLAVLRSELATADWKAIESKGRGPIRRLTRSEYEDNLRDLLALPQLDIRNKLPEDRVSHGYTKVAKLLDMSRVHLNAYLEASEAALLEAVAPSVEPSQPRKWRFTGTDLFSSLTTFGGTEAMFFIKDGKRQILGSGHYKQMTAEQRKDPELELAVFRSATWPYYGYPRGFKAPEDGTYRVRFSGRAVRQVQGFRIAPAHDPLPMSFRTRQPSGPDVSGDVQETGGWMDLMPENQDFETTIEIRKGETFEYSFLGLPVPFIRTDGGFFYDYPPMPPEGHIGGVLRWLEVEGPLVSETWPPESHTILFGDLPIAPRVGDSRLPVSIETKTPKKDAERLFRKFADHVSRRPLDESVYSKFVQLIYQRLDAGKSFGDAMLTGYQAFLCSGHFLYMEDRMEKDSYSIASQLSHFLWNTHPDLRLMELAGENRLLAKEVLQAEASRMIAAPQFERFVSGFTDSWLDLRELRRDIPDNRLYPEYRKDDYLVASMEVETRLFFRHLVRENQPVTSIVDCDYTFANDRLAKHYQLPRVSGSAMRKIDLPQWSPYGGILTQASILKHTSNGTTTSPVLRGVWVMEKLLGNPPPPPPKSIPAIEPDIRGAATIRDILAKHTEVKSCANCHAYFDPVGFALENFDVMGAWRDFYRGLENGDKITGYDPAGHPYTYFIGKPVEAEGQLIDGEAFSDVNDLKQLLAARPRQLAKNLVEQLTLYATGTPVRFSERAEVERILDDCESDGYRVRDLMMGLIGSEIFMGSR